MPLTILLSLCSQEDSYYVGRGQKYNQSGYTSMLGPGGGKSGGKPLISISKPQEFRQVSSIIDVDVVPETCRRVRLLKHGSDKPLGNNSKLIAWESVPCQDSY